MFSVYDLHNLADLEGLSRALDTLSLNQTLDGYDYAAVTAAAALVEERIKALREAIAVTQGLAKDLT